MQVLRTRDDRFADLVDCGRPSYAEVLDPDGDDGSTLRMAHVDAGPADAPVVLHASSTPCSRGAKAVSRASTPAAAAACSTWIRS